MYKDFLYETKEDGTPFEMIERDIDLHGDDFWKSMDDMEFEFHYGITKKDFLFSYSAEYSLYTREKLVFSRIDTTPFTESSLEKMMEDFRDESIKYLSTPKITGSKNAQKIRNAAKIAPTTSAKPSAVKKTAENKFAKTVDKRKNKKSPKPILESIESKRTDSPEYKLKKEFNSYIKEILRQGKNSLAKRKINLKYKALKAAMANAGIKWGSPEWQVLVHKFFPDGNFTSISVEESIGDLTNSVGDDDSILLKKENSTSPTKTENEIIPDGEATDIPEELKLKVKDKTGTKINDVKAYKNDNSATEIGAKAYTKDNSIHFATGQFNPEEKEGKKLIAHELTHVSQGEKGKVKEPYLKQAIDETETSELEDEADLVADEIVSDEKVNSAENINDSSDNNEDIKSENQEITSETDENTQNDNNEIDSDNLVNDEETDNGEKTFIDQSDDTENLQTENLEVINETSVNSPNDKTNNESLDETSNSQVPGNDAASATIQSTGNSGVGSEDNTTTQVNSEEISTGSNQADSNLLEQTVEGESDEFANFRTQIKQRKTSLIDSASKVKKGLEDSAEIQKQKLTADLGKEDGEIGKTYNNQIKAIKKAFRKLKQTVNEGKKGKKAKAKLNYLDEKAKQEALYDSKCVELDSKANEIANKLIADAQSEGDKIMLLGYVQMDAAIEKGNEKAEVYKDKERGGQISSELRQFATKVGEAMLKGDGGEFLGAIKIAEKANNEAKSAAEEIRQSTKEVKKELKKGLKNYKKELKTRYKATTKNLDDLAGSVIKELELEVNRQILALEGKRDGDIGKFTRYAKMVCADIDKQTSKAKSIIDEQINSTNIQIDEFYEEAQAEFGTETGESANTAFGLLLKQIDDSLIIVHGNLNNYSRASKDSLSEGVSQTAAKVKEDSQGVTGMNGEEGKTDSGMNVAAQNIIAEMDKVVQEGNKDMSAITKDLTKSFNSSITDLDKEISKAASDKLVSIQKMVNDGITQMESIITELPDKLDEKAEELMKESFWDRLGKFAVGFVKGLFKIFVVLYDLAKSNLLLFLLVIAIIVVLIVLAINFAVVGTILLVVGIVVGLIFLGIAIHKLVTQWDTLTDEQRGECFGEIVFELAMLVLSVFQVVKLVRGVKAIQTVKVANTAKGGSFFSRIVNGVVKTEKTLRIINAAGKTSNLKTLLQLTNNNINQLDDLLRLVANGDDLIKVIGFVGKADDVGATIKTLGISGKNLARIIKTGKVVNLKQLVSWQTKIKDPKQLLRILKNKIITDSSVLDDLLRNPAINNGDDLEEYLKLVDNLEDLKGLLGKSGPKVQTRSLEVLAPNGRIPSAKRGFNKWFDELTPNELDLLWSNKDIKDQIGAAIRDPGGKHEWYMVAEVKKFKKWGVLMEEIKRIRTETLKLKGTNPNTGEGFAHSVRTPTRINPGPGSKTFHNALQKIIKNAETLDEVNQGIIDLLVQWQIDPKLVPLFK